MKMGAETTSSAAVQALGNSDDDGTDSELHTFEVSFDEAGIRRRKSSLVASTRPQGRHPQHLTNCFVHQLLGEFGEEGNRTPIVDLPSASQIIDKMPLEPLNQHAPTQSRLLTKQQLSDMSLGIRELSKKLAHMKLKPKVRNIFLLTKIHDDTLVEHTRELSEWLLKSSPAYNVYVEDSYEHNPLYNYQEILASDPSFTGRLRFWDVELCRKKPQTFDIVIALGGDGTVLYASWLFQRVVPPVLSFAMGSLGFLTKFDFQGYQETLTRMFNDGFLANVRLRLEVTVMRSQRPNKKRDLVEELIGEECEDDTTHRPGETYNILNEVVIDRGPNPTMSTIEVFGDNEHFTTMQADGICVATPTGSTAYNMAAGGSLCHPDNPIILLTAICAHTLSFRPVILPDTMVLRVGVPYDARTGSWASFDGRKRVELHPGDYVTISASRYPFPSVLPLDRKKDAWIDSLSRTLNWNSRQRQKAWVEGGKADGAQP
ncbi:ATP-NAD kinase [Trichodelitschia bisporula]|uniref:ATP-NAD kinase n=1 Tax=Trichodelitschia bisporula TaxID=703511 RepID=A0A6G1HLE8_9PEZI|nr:ATP-NAD kinase [Trichodelitschia bisporula]